MLSQALNPENKTRIMYACNLSYQQLNVHLSTLLENELIKATINPHKHGTCSIGWYKTTERGTQFIKAYEKLESILNRGQKHELERASCKLRAEPAHIEKFMRMTKASRSGFCPRCQRKKGEYASKRVMAITAT